MVVVGCVGTVSGALVSDVADFVEDVVQVGGGERMKESEEH